VLLWTAGVRDSCLLAVDLRLFLELSGAQSALGIALVFAVTDPIRSSAEGVFRCWLVVHRSVLQGILLPPDTNLTVSGVG